MENNASLEMGVIISRHTMENCDRVKMKKSSLQRLANKAVQHMDNWVDYKSNIRNYCFDKINNKLFDKIHLKVRLAIYDKVIYVFDDHHHDRPKLVTHYGVPKKYWRYL